MTRLWWVFVAALSACGGDEPEQEPSGGTNPVVVEELRVWPTNLSLVVGQTAPILATAQLEKRAPVEWTIDDTSIATVESASTGVARITGVSAGEFELTAKAENGVEATIRYRVAPARPDSTAADLAAALSNLADGMLRTERTLGPRRGVLEQQLVDALVAELPDARHLAIHVAESAISSGNITAADLSFGTQEVDGVAIGPTCDPIFEFHVNQMLESRSIDDPVLNGGADSPCYMTDGPTAGGVYVSDEYEQLADQDLVRGEFITNGPHVLVQLSDEPSVVTRFSRVNSNTRNQGDLNLPTTSSVLVLHYLRAAGFELPGESRAGIGAWYGYELAREQGADLQGTEGFQSIALRKSHDCPECVVEFDIPEPAGAITMCEDGTVYLYDAQGSPIADAVVTHARATGHDSSSVLYSAVDRMTGVTDAAGSVRFDTNLSADFWTTEALGAGEYRAEDQPFGIVTTRREVAHRFDGDALPMGTSLNLRQLGGNVTVAQPDASCDVAHLHSASGIWLDCQDGPYVDPDPNGCGFGPLGGQ